MRTGYNRSNFYERIKKLVKWGCLSHTKGKSPAHFQAKKEVIERLSEFLREDASKDEVPRDFPENGNGKEKPLNVPSKIPEIITPIIRTHNINVVIPYLIPRILYENIKQNDQSFSFIEAGNVSNLTGSFNIQNGEGSFTATIQLFRKTVLIRLNQVLGHDVYVNISEIHRRVKVILDWLTNRYHRIRFHPATTWKFPRKKSSIYGLEHALPGYPTGEGEHWESVGDEGDVVGWDHSKGLGELEVKGQTATENMEKIVSDIKFTLENDFGIPEVHEKFKDLSTSLQLHSSLSEELQKNQVILMQNYLQNQTKISFLQKCKNFFRSLN